jgi:hypothetical protein
VEAETAGVGDLHLGPPDDPAGRRHQQSAARQPARLSLQQIRREPHRLGARQGAGEPVPDRDPTGTVPGRDRVQLVRRARFRGPQHRERRDGALLRQPERLRARYLERGIREQDRGDLGREDRLANETDDKGIHKPAQHAASCVAERDLQETVTRSSRTWKGRTREEAPSDPPAGGEEGQPELRGRSSTYRSVQVKSVWSFCRTSWYTLDGSLHHSSAFRARQSKLFT